MDTHLFVWLTDTNHNLMLTSLDILMIPTHNGTFVSAYPTELPYGR